MHNRRIVIYWIIWITLLVTAIAASLYLYFQRPGTTDFFLPFAFLYFIAVIGAGVIHFVEGYKLSSCVWKRYRRRIQLLSNISILSFVYSGELSNDSQVRLLKQNYKQCVVLFSSIPVTFLVFAGVLFVL